jgi:valacyclovir hydrolase
MLVFAPGNKNMPIVETSTGATLHYTERNPQASGAPIVAIHGLLGTAERDLGNVMDWLAEEGYRVLGLTLRGYGESGPKPRDFPHDFYHRDAKDTIAFLDALHIDKAHLMGYSDGGETVMAAAGLAPDRVASVIAWGAVGSFGPELRPIFQRTYPGDWITDEVKALHGFTDARAFTGEWVKATQMMLDLGGDVSLSLAPNITCPLLMMLGENDTLNPQFYGEKFAKAAQNGRLEMLPGGHPVHLEQFERFKELIEPFLKAAAQKAV